MPAGRIWVICAGATVTWPVDVARSLNAEWTSKAARRPGNRQAIRLRAVARRCGLGGHRVDVVPGQARLAERAGTPWPAPGTACGNGWAWPRWPLFGPSSRGSARLPAYACKRARSRSFGPASNLWVTPDSVLLTRRADAPCQSETVRCAFASGGRWPRAGVAGQQARLVLFWLAR